VCAAPYQVTGTFKWGPLVAGGKISTAQELIQGGEAGFREPLSGRIILECEDQDIRIVPSVTHYYSAYLWIMFLIVDRNDNPFFPERWKNLLVYFEHANIADASTFQTLKETLVSKVCSSVTEILLRGSDAEKIAIRYACAFDDSVCGRANGALLFPPHPGVAGAATTLLEILKEAKSRKPVDHPLKSRRLLLPENPSPRNRYSSCELPRIVEEFYHDLRHPTLPAVGH
jgi:hypothetical protein